MMGSMAAYEMHNYAAVASGAEERNEKYSLRQRQKRKWSHTNNNNNNNNSKNYATAKAPKSTGSGRNEEAKFSPTAMAPSPPNAHPTNTPCKAKSKAPPLSKYRRKTANARERSRMREINSAFETLRQCVPQAVTAGEATSSSNEKLTKITTLRMAMKYIRLLNEALHNPEATDMGFLWQTCQTAMESDGDGDGELDDGVADFSESDNAAPQDVDEMACARVHRATAKAKKRSSGKPTTKSAKSSKQFELAPLCCTASELDTLLLESDGESLHFSEHCLSPLQPAFGPHQLLSATTRAATPQTKLTLHSSPSPASSSSPNDNPFELSSSAFESNDSIDSLDFGIAPLTDLQQQHQQQPYLSPLINAYDIYSPFNDILHSEFVDHAALDLFSS